MIRINTIVSVVAGIWLSWFLLNLPAIATTVDGSTQLEQQVLQIIRDNPEVLIETLQRYQQQQQEAQAAQQQANAARLLADASTVLANSPVRGQAEAPIVLIEFSDFQCPFCARSQTVLKEFLQQQPEIRLVFKHFPLSRIHDQALPAAQAAWAAQQQGQFWEYHDRLFAQQEALSEALFVAIAKDLNLNLDKFNRDRRSQQVQAAIQRDMALAQQLQIQGTPLFVMYQPAKADAHPVIFYGVNQVEDLERVLAQVHA